MQFGTILDLKTAAEKSFGQGFLRLVAPDSLQLSGFRHGDNIAAAAQQPKLAATQIAFAVWCIGADKVVTWGHPKQGGDSFEVKDQLKNVQQICGTSRAFAAVLADRSVVTWVSWGEPNEGGDIS